MESCKIIINRFIVGNSWQNGKIYIGVFDRNINEYIAGGYGGTFTSTKQEMELICMRLNIDEKLYLRAIKDYVK